MPECDNLVVPGNESSKLKPLYVLHLSKFCNLLTDLFVPLALSHKRDDFL